MSLPRYPEYKDSGVAWLGEVPGHWGVPQSKRLFRRRKELNAGMACENRLALTMGGVVPRALDDLDGLQASEFETYQLFQKDDLAFKLIDLQNIKTSRVGIVPEMGIMSPAYIRLEANLSRLWPKFGYWYFTDLYNRQVFNQLGGGVRQTLGPEELLVLACTAPPLAEQQTIAAFLDCETGKIDALIAEQQRLVGLLAEKRQAVISHAVTKGLNPKARMKDSGIEWLGEVPEHWRVGKCGFYLTILSGFAFPSTGFSEDETDTKLLRGINVGVSRLKWDETVYWERSLDDRLDAYKMQAGDVVIGMDRPLISEGMRVAKVKESDLPCLLLQRVASLKVGTQLDSDYLLGLLSSEMFVAHFLPETTGVSVPHISPEQINNFVIPVPPLEEQQAIATFLDTETAKFDTLTAEANRAIALLQERRSALISAAVTGKIDVRQAA